MRCGAEEKIHKYPHLRLPCSPPVPHGHKSSAQQAGKQEGMRHAAITPEVTVLKAKNKPMTSRSGPIEQTAPDSKTGHAITEC